MFMEDILIFRVALTLEKGKSMENDTLFYVAESVVGV
jgi:hypothetical protein